MPCQEIILASLLGAVCCIWNLVAGNGGDETGQTYGYFFKKLFSVILIFIFIYEFPVLCSMWHLVYRTRVSELSLKRNLMVSGGQNSTSVYTCTSVYIRATEPTIPQTGDIQGTQSKKAFGIIYSEKWQRVDKFQNICPKGECITVLSSLRFYFHEHTSSLWIMYEHLTAGDHPPFIVKWNAILMPQNIPLNSLQVLCSANSQITSILHFE